MTPAEWAEYYRRVELREAHRRWVREQAGITDAPGQFWVWEFSDQ